MLQTLLHGLGYGLCHQLPERSFFGGAVQVPVCARDTGIYAGFIVSLLVIWLVHRPERPKEFPGPAAFSAIGLMIAAMAIDGFTSYAGLRTTTNDLRLITGILAGFAMAALVAPMLNDELWSRRDPGRVLSPGWRLAAWLCAVPVVFGAIRWVAPWMGPAYPVLVAIAIVATLTTVNLVIVSLFPPFERKASRIWDAWPAILVALLMSVGEIVASAAFRAAIESVARKVG